jgi:hypothetical protein
MKSYDGFTLNVQLHPVMHYYDTEEEVERRYSDVKPRQAYDR